MRSPTSAAPRPSRSSAGTTWPGRSDPPGPRLGELLAEIAEARFAGEVGTRDEAVAYARGLLVPAPG
jgi:hypothetical protein